MTEDHNIIRMNIAHYRAMLTLDIDAQKRSVVERLIAEANDELVLATDTTKPR